MNTVFIVCQDALQVLHQRITLEAAGELNVVGADTHQRRAAAVIADRRPDLLVATLRAQDGPVVGLLQDLRDRAARYRPKVLLIAASDSDPRLIDGLRAGGDSYWVDAPGPGMNLAARAKQLLRGEAEMSPAIARSMLLQFERSDRAARRNPTAEILNPMALNDVERAVLLALATGQAVPDIAVEQNLRLQQVRAHLLSIYRKLHWDCKASSFSLAA